MIRKVIKYENVDGDEREFVAYFHLTRDDLVAFMVQNGGTAKDPMKFLADMLKNEDLEGIYRILKQIIRMAYGKRLEDGEFDKSDEEDTNRFMSSLALDALMTEIEEGGQEGAVEFFTGMLPRKLAAMAAAGPETPAAEPEAPKELPWAHRRPTNKELMTMTREQLLEVMQRDSGKSSQE